MDAERFARARELFRRCIESTDAEREALLGEADEDLRREVESLLEHDAPGDPDATTGAPLRAMIESALVESIEQDELPERIGPFRVVRELGRGGMGVVYEAEQDEPRRRVAVKVVPALASADLGERMRREAQALALVEDPGVARVYETGVATVFGRRTPYIAMEFVEGEPIDAWAATHTLSTRERLELVARVADAVQTAHSRGVIHRDLKPANILVSPDRTGPGRPTVLDFGIARLDQPGVTLTGADTSGPIGTLQYMAPEQMSGDARLIDARSDVYGLGAVAYAVLQGRPPHDLKGKSLTEAAAEILDREPPPLSGVERALRADVQLVVSKAMSKEPGRRYQTAEAFAGDLRRIVADEPVFARPPNVAYKLSKFVRRNRVLTASTAVVFFLLIGSLVVVGQQRERAVVSANTAEAVSAFLTDMLRSIDPDLARGGEVRVADVLEDARRRLDQGELDDQPEVRARLRTVIGEILAALGRYDESIDELGRALAITERVSGSRSAPTADALERLAAVQTTAGAYEIAEANLERAAIIRASTGQERTSGEDATLGSVYYWTGRYDEAERYFRAVLDRSRGRSPDARLRSAGAYRWLGSTLEMVGRMDESIDAHERAVAIYTDVFGERHTQVADALNSLANAHEANGDYAAARAAHERSLTIKRSLLRDDHPAIATSLNNFSIVLAREGDYAGAEELVQEAARIRRDVLGERHPSTASSYGNLARTILEQGRLDEALAAYDDAVRVATDAVGREHVMTCVFRANRGVCLTRLGRFDEAEPILLEVHAQLSTTLGPDHRRTVIVEESLVELYESWGRPSDAARWRSGS